MKALLALTLIAASLTLTSCKSCPFAPKKDACCQAGCTKPCCAKKTADCKTCSH